MSTKAKRPLWPHGGEASEDTLRCATVGASVQCASWGFRPLRRNAARMMGAQSMPPTDAASGAPTHADLRPVHEYLQWSLQCHSQAKKKKTTRTALSAKTDISFVPLEIVHCCAVAGAPLLFLLELRFLHSSRDCSTGGGGGSEHR